MTTRRLVAITVLLWSAASLAAVAQTPLREVSYRFQYGQAGDAAVSIEIAWGGPLAEPRSLVMPRAIPMGYGEQRYDAFVMDVRAFTADGRATTPEREEGPRWRVGAGATRVTYRVDLRQLDQTIKAASDASRVRDGYLGALGYSVFAFLDGDETRPTRLRVEGPSGWPVFVTLAPTWPVTAAPVEARAPDFYAMADGQIVMGPRAVVRRLIDTPIPLYLATTAFQRVTEYFGTVPFTHYTVHQELLAPVSSQHEYGMSMEHMDSSTYYLAASTGLTSASTEQDAARVLYNFAHHMAHAWVPKRVYGEGYFPFQWELAPVLDSIWFAEGFGQYAAIMAIAAGTPDPDAFREGMLNRRFRANIAGAPAFLQRLSLVELSRVASTRYAEDFRTGRLVFSRGGLMAAAMDDRIRTESKGARSLRDALRFMVAWAARERRAFRNDELASLIRQATGIDTAGVIAEWLRPAQPRP